MTLCHRRVKPALRPALNGALQRMSESGHEVLDHLRDRGAQPHRHGAYLIDTASGRAV